MTNYLEVFDANLRSRQVDAQVGVANEQRRTMERANKRDQQKQDRGVYESEDKAAVEKNRVTELSSKTTAAFIKDNPELMQNSMYAEKQTAILQYNAAQTDQTNDDIFKAGTEWQQIYNSDPSRAKGVLHSMNAADGTPVTKAETAHIDNFSDKEAAMQVQMHTQSALYTRKYTQQMGLQSAKSGSDLDEPDTGYFVGSDGNYIPRIQGQEIFNKRAGTKEAYWTSEEDGKLHKGMPPNAVNFVKTATGTVKTDAGFGDPMQKIIGPLTQKLTKYRGAIMSIDAALDSSSQDIGIVFRSKSKINDIQTSLNELINGNPELQGYMQEWQGSTRPEDLSAGTLRTANVFLAANDFVRADSRGKGVYSKQGMEAIQNILGNKAWWKDPEATNEVLRALRQNLTNKHMATSSTIVSIQEGTYDPTALPSPATANKRPLSFGEVTLEMYNEDPSLYGIGTWVILPNGDRQQVIAGGEE